MPDDDARAMLATIESEQRRLRAILAGKDTSTLVQRPPSDKWSVLENVCHLVFAEQHHLGRFVPGSRKWSTAGLPPHSLPAKARPRMVGTAESSLSEVLEAWQALHASVAEFARADTEEDRKSLDINLRHLRAHIEVIQRMLRARS